MRTDLPLVLYDPLRDLLGAEQTRTHVRIRGCGTFDLLLPLSSTRWRDLIRARAPHFERMGVAVRSAPIRAQPMAPQSSRSDQSVCFFSRWTTKYISCAASVLQQWSSCTHHTQVVSCRLCVETGRVPVQKWWEAVMSELTCDVGLIQSGWHNCFVGSAALDFFFGRHAVENYKWSWAMHNVGFMMVRCIWRRWRTHGTTYGQSYRLPMKLAAVSSRDNDHAFIASFEYQSANRGSTLKTRRRSSLYVDCTAGSFCSAFWSCVRAMHCCPVSCHFS